MIENRSGEWTLTEAARLLGEPQHRLIYLCEKEVVSPDLQDAGGRGSSRRFSARNLLEFAVALRLRELEIPASFVAAVIYVLRAFEGSVKKQIPEFSLPGSLRTPKSLDLRVVVSDGGRLYLTLGTGKETPKVYGGIDLQGLAAKKKPLRSLQRQLALVASAQTAVRAGSKGQEFGGPEGSRHSRVEISVTRIAQDLTLDG